MSTGNPSSYGIQCAGLCVLSPAPSRTVSSTYSWQQSNGTLPDHSRITATTAKCRAPKDKCHCHTASTWCREAGISGNRCHFSVAVYRLGCGCLSAVFEDNEPRNKSELSSSPGSTVFKHAIFLLKGTPHLWKQLKACAWTMAAI